MNWKEKDKMIKLQSKKKTTDMTQGKPGPLILNFAIPMILGNVVQQLYSMVDSAVVGRFVGKEALAGIGASASILMLIICIIIGFTMGTCIITAQYFGAGEEDMVKHTAGTAVYVSFAMWIFIAALGAVAGEPVLRALNTPEEIIDGARTYLLINTMTGIAPITYNMTANIMRALGDSKGPLYALIVSSALNIILDLVFVIEFHWGIPGVAWATAISQLISTLVNLYRIKKQHKVLSLGREHLKLRPDIVKKVIKVGIPMSIQNAVASLGALGIQRIVNGYGTAAYTAGGKIDQIAMMPLSSLGLAVSTYTAQNFGKKDYGRIREGLKAALLQAVVLGLFLLLVIQLLGRPLTLLFVSAKETEVISVSVEYLKTVSAFYWLCGIMYIFLNVFRGMEKMTISTVASCLDPLVRLAGAVVLGNVFGRSALWFGWPVGWAAALLLPVIMYVGMLGKKRFQ